MENLKYFREMLPLSNNFRIGIFAFILASLIACQKSKKTLPMSLSPEEYTRELAENVNILYSDSATVKMKITSPLMYRYVENRKSIEEFPEGLIVEFYDENQNITSWLEADYALRKESDDIILVKENVSLYNKRKEKLETDELIYDSKKGIISTDKFVKITQPIRI